MIYYNPTVIQDKPLKCIRDVVEIPQTDTFYNMYKRNAKKNEKEAYDCDYGGFIEWFDNGILYRGLLVQPWEWIPVTDTEIDDGINWNTVYATTIDRLIEFTGCDADVVKKCAIYTYGLYSVQVHYDKRVR